ncbi:MAG: glycosyltransferase [Candidatus Thermoplasmatota archaeon]|nr:glycosyltransferase [Candidatus Thermoplasmatota archaeon]
MLSTVTSVQSIPEYTSGRISIIIPAYNEENRIKPVLNELASFIQKNGFSWNIIVSIDGNDGTLNLVEELSEKYPFISTVKNHGRGGKGNAIKQAINTVNGNFVILMDADGSMNLVDLVSHIHLMDKYDAVIFDRYTNRENEIPFMRRFASRGFNVLVRSLLGVNVNDTQCGYKIIKTEYAKKAFGKVSVTNTFFDVALLYYLRKSGAKCVEFPINYSHDAESKFNLFSEIIGQGISLLAFRIRNSRFYRFVPKKFVELYYRKFRWI